MPNSVASDWRRVSWEGQSCITPFAGKALFRLWCFVRTRLGDANAAGPRSPDEYGATRPNPLVQRTARLADGLRRARRPNVFYFLSRLVLHDVKRKRERFRLGCVLVIRHLSRQLLMAKLRGHHARNLDDQF